ncbi:hypothetical protein Slin14017_G120960 [Septoria linicola]|nr:hypothetical protein Slin14017_G120960 [Septoria linicola]
MKLLALLLCIFSTALALPTPAANHIEPHPVTPPDFDDYGYGKGIVALQLSQKKDGSDQTGPAPV